VHFQPVTREELDRIERIVNEQIVANTAVHTEVRSTEEAIAFMRRSKEKPFFVYLPYTMPHVPLFASDAHAGASPRGLFGDTVEEIDSSAGAILSFLRREGLAENSLVLFTSDNGPWLIQGPAGGTAGLLTDGKGGTWEGGLRVPGLAWWPGRIPSGRVSAGMASTLDIFPTAVGLAGGSIPADRPMDGVDMLPLLTGTGPSRRGVFFYYRDETIYAVRKGPWKAHFRTRIGYGQPQPREHEPPLLFHLEQDPGERFDLAADHPEVIAEIRTELQRHQATVGAVQNQLEIPLEASGK